MQVIEIHRVFNDNRHYVNRFHFLISCENLFSQTDQPAVSIRRHSCVAAFARKVQHIFLTGRRGNVKARSASGTQAAPAAIPPKLSFEIPAPAAIQSLPRTPKSKIRKIRISPQIRASAYKQGIYPHFRLFVAYSRLKRKKKVILRLFYFSKKKPLKKRCHSFTILHL